MNNNFYRKYYSIIINRQRNPLPDDVYGEKHHILPKSIYPLFVNNPGNIVRLTPYEHLKAHYYLMKLFQDLGNEIAYQKMLYAVVQMGKRMFCKRMVVTEYDLERSAEIYNEAKGNFARMMSERNKGRKLTEEHRQKISMGMMGHPVSELTRIRMRLAKLGKKRGPMKTRSDKGKKRGPRKTSIQVCN